MDLFTHAMHDRMKSEAPLAARTHPRTLDEFAGQEHILGQGKLLRRAIESDRLFSSIILWGPPGTGKTTLAMVVANLTASHFETLSAVLAGKAELRTVIDAALERRKLYQKKTILFVKDVVETLNWVQRQGLPASAGFGGTMPKGRAAFGAESLKCGQRPHLSTANDVRCGFD